MSDSSLIRTNADGSPVVSVRTIRGRTVLMAHLRKGDQWVEVPATKVIAMVGKKAAPVAVANRPDRKAKTASQLREITDRYVYGGTR